MHHVRQEIRLRRLLLFTAMAGLLFLPASSTMSFSPAPAEPSAEAMAALGNDCSQPVTQDWIQRVRRIRWVAYSSPGKSLGGSLTIEAINKDLRVLKRAGFTGLITYGSAGLMGKRFLAAAEEYDFKGVIMGIWDPTSPVEINNAIRAASMPVVMGYNIGNEGVSWPDERYSLSSLCSAIAGIRAATGKPVSTSEAIHIYYRQPELFWTGDWIFPNAHPYWHNVKYPDEAIGWEQDQYAALAQRTDHFIFFKEVGLPSAGAHGLSELNQDRYYRGLEKTQVQFAYFEGFDQPSKVQNTVEPHWGIFHADLAPKLLAWNLMGYRPFTSGAGSDHRVLQCPGSSRAGCKPKTSVDALLVGRDIGERSYWSVLTFNTAGLPDNAEITSIKLKIRVGNIAGADPLQGGRHILVDICRPNAPRMPWSNPGQDSAKEYCVSNAGKVSMPPRGGWLQVDLSPEALTAINKTGETTLRMRLDRSARQAGRRGYIAFESGTESPEDGPILVVRYRVP